MYVNGIKYFFVLVAVNRLIKVLTNLAFVMIGSGFIVGYYVQKFKQPQMLILPKNDDVTSVPEDDYVNSKLLENAADLYISKELPKGGKNTKKPKGEKLQQKESTKKKHKEEKKEKEKKEKKEAKAKKEDEKVAKKKEAKEEKAKNEAKEERKAEAELRRRVSEETRTNQKKSNLSMRLPHTMYFGGSF
ncbi:hypothetical protein Mgra_00005426 [Meloidogyne graminicola]|uniref:Uncharacterized protein n=1 Tax=Meloidogyne graminicola TaxID=189291 RepID=A0A8S9ZNY3_9BILA|nr:hypothetical protein Mgra_00005426 [Meloidogyne graminicola]